MDFKLKLYRAWQIMLSSLVEPKHLREIQLKMYDLDHFLPKKLDRALGKSAQSSASLIYFEPKFMLELGPVLLIADSDKKVSRNVV